MILSELFKELLCNNEYFFVRQKTYSELVYCTAGVKNERFHPSLMAQTNECKNVYFIVHQN